MLPSVVFNIQVILTVRFQFSENGIKLCSDDDLVIPVFKMSLNASIEILPWHQLQAEVASHQINNSKYTDQAK